MMTLCVVAGLFKLFALFIFSGFFIQSCVYSPLVLTAATALRSVPTLKLIPNSTVALKVNFPSPTTAFEGGTILKMTSGLHLFTTDISQGLNTTLVYYHAPPANGSKTVYQAFQFVRKIVCCSSATSDGHDNRASLWAPMPVFDKLISRWRLFYVQYRSGGSNCTGWCWNWHGEIVSTVSVVEGLDGIGGPYENPARTLHMNSSELVDVVLRPDSDSQNWEGEQGTDSLSPPYLLRDGKTWAAFYGSAKTELCPPVTRILTQNVSQQFNNDYCYWNVGLVTTSTLGSDFRRQLPTSLVNLNGGYAENPIVTYLAQKDVYVAVFDDLRNQNTGFGVSWSKDGLNWSLSSEVVGVPTGTRTPLRAYLLSTSTVAGHAIDTNVYTQSSNVSVINSNNQDACVEVFYTAGNPERPWHARFHVNWEAVQKSLQELDRQ